jgi:hypothetical protein
MKTSSYGLNSKTSKTSFRWLPLGTWISKFWVRGASSWPKRLREPKFQLSSSYGQGCRRGTNFAYGNGDGNGDGNSNGNGAWQMELFLSLKSCILAIDSPKTWNSAIKNFHFSHHETNTSLIFHKWQVKITRVYIRLSAQIDYWRLLKWFKIDGLINFTLNMVLVCNFFINFVFFTNNLVNSTKKGQKKLEIVLEN